jgi:hypothetical protein
MTMVYKVRDRLDRADILEATKGGVCFILNGGIGRGGVFSARNDLPTGRFHFSFATPGEEPAELEVDHQYFENEPDGIPEAVMTWLRLVTGQFGP